MEHKIKISTTVPMTFPDKIKEAKAEAKRFLKRCEEWEAQQGRKDDFGHRIDTPKESGAVRRASMDLTRSLANLRRYS